MDMSGLMTKMVIFVVLMVIGYFCAKIGMATPEFTRTTSKLVINFFMCATILNSVISTELNVSGSELATAFLVVTITIVTGYIVAAIASRLLPMEDEKRPLFELLIAVVNNMFIALPVVDQLFGAQAVFYCSLSNLPYNILLYTYGVWRLKSGDGDKVSIKDIISIPLICTCTAVLIFMLRIPMPGVVKELVKSVSGATMPLSMIVIGSSLGTVTLGAAFKQWRLYIMSFCRLIVAPFIVWFLCRFVTSDPMLLATAVIIGASPSAVVVSVLTIKYEKNAIFTSQGILHSTALAMFTIPAIVYLMM